VLLPFPPEPPANVVEPTQLANKPPAPPVLPDEAVPPFAKRPLVVVVGAAGVKLLNQVSPPLVGEDPAVPAVPIETYAVALAVNDSDVILA
jgi:hypothetical protein